LITILIISTVFSSAVLGFTTNPNIIKPSQGLYKIDRAAQTPNTYPTKPLTVYVDDDYSPSTPGWQKTRFDKIQDGIGAVAKNGKVKVNNGIYYENIVINKTIKLIGENKYYTIIDAGFFGSVIIINADKTTVKSFTIQHSGYDWEDEGIELNSNENIISNNEISENEYGIMIENFHGNEIINNNISTSCLFGLTLHHSTNNIITGNFFWNNSKGIAFFEDCNDNIISENIFLDNFNGIGFIYNSNNNKIIDNNFNNCSGEAISIYFNCNFNEIIGNTIIFTGGYAHAVYFIDCSDNTIKNNSITHNKQSGIYLKECTSFTIVGNTIGYNVYQGLVIYPSGTGHLIYHNNFMNNLYKNVVDAGTNTWDNGFEGNYYDDFEQNPGYPNFYEIYGGDNKDNHPLLQPYE